MRKPLFCSAWMFWRYYLFARIIFSGCVPSFAKKMGSCSQEGAQGTGEDWLWDTMIIMKSGFFCMSSHHFMMCIGHVLFSPLLDCDRQAAGMCLCITHKETRTISTRHL